MRPLPIPPGLFEPGGCGCGGHAPSRPPAPPPRRRRRGCCKELIDAIARIPGVELPELHKPKQAPATKTATLCDASPVQDAVLPWLIALMARHKAKLPARGPIEEAAYAALSGLPKTGREALQKAAGAIDALPAHLRACLLSDALAGDLDERPVSEVELIAHLVSEGLLMTVARLFPSSGGAPGPGTKRPFVRSFPRLDATPVKVTAAWPWITAIRPEFESFKEYGNTESYRPVPGAPPHVFEEYQFATTCSAVIVGASSVASCVRVAPDFGPAPGPGSTTVIAADPCEGGDAYQSAGYCLALPSVPAGGSFAIRGFNLTTATVRVQLIPRTPGHPTLNLTAQVFGDIETPATIGDQVVADLRVRDFATAELPRENPLSPGSPLHPGLYDVQVFVPNTEKVTIDGIEHPELTSNTLVLRVEPDPDTPFTLWSDRGHCHEETDGLGSDEIWWDAWVIHVAGSALAVGPHEEPAVAIRKVSVDRGAWDDMDSGEGPGPYSATLWDGPLGRGGVLACAILGLEVDSEEAARQQITSFDDAYALYFSETLGSALKAADKGMDIADLIGVSLTTQLYGLALAAAVYLVVGLFWAAWAPADRIGIDHFTLDPLSAWRRTDTAEPLPAAESFAIQEISVHHNPLGRVEPVATSAIYEEDHRFITPEDGEDSDYSFVLRLSRGAPA